MKKLDCILLVDDDEDCNFFHRRLIRKMNCTKRIEEAKNGQQALDLIHTDRNYNIDLILLDVNMPVMDGWQFLDHYENLPEHKRSSMVVVMLTSSVNPDDEQKAKGRGWLAGFVNKYLDEAKLSDILNDLF